MSLGLPQNVGLCQFYNPHTYVYAKRLKKIGPKLVVAEIFGEICRFLPFRPNRCSFALVISGVTEPILITFAQDVAEILPLNIFESKLP